MREIQEHLKEIYQTEVTAEFISSVTDKVIEEVTAWRNRPLESVYPIVYLDAMVVKVKENSHIINKSLYIAMGVNMEGHKEILGLWLAKSEGAKFWLLFYITELKNRGVEAIYIACIDGLKGFNEAINSVFPKTVIQRCIVHLVRNSLNYAPWKDKRAVATGLRLIYTAPSGQAAYAALSAFAGKWGNTYPAISAAWQQHWQEIIPSFMIN